MQNNSSMCLTMLQSSLHFRAMQANLLRADVPHIPQLLPLVSEPVTVQLSPGLSKETACDVLSCFADTAGCAGDPCNSDAHAIAGSCVDVPAPGVNYNCSCTAGYSWNLSSTTCEGERTHARCVGSTSACRYAVANTVVTQPVVLCWLGGLSKLLGASEISSVAPVLLSYWLQIACIFDTCCALPGTEL